MYGPPPVGKRDRLRLKGSASMYPAFVWSGGSRATMEIRTHRSC